MNVKAVHKSTYQYRKGVPYDVRAAEVLRALAPHAPRWVRPQDIGAGSASHHTRTLITLRRTGLVERRPRGGFEGPGARYLYRLTPAGQQAATGTAP